MVKAFRKWRLSLILILYQLNLTAQEGVIQDENRKQPLYVSLGAHCEVANFIGYNGLRTAAYPFDWMLTLNRSLISVLEQDFIHFVDSTYLKHHRYGVVNTYYQIDFRHDWPDFGFSWPQMDIRKTLPEIQDKYERRISRFYELADHQGKVFFIRAPLDIDYSLEAYPTFSKESKRITFEEAQTLRNLLKSKFPALDFTLVIVNYFEENTGEIVGIENVCEFKVRLFHKFIDWERLLHSLENEAISSSESFNTTAQSVASY